jgi:hypothetical protein
MSSEDQRNARKRREAKLQKQKAENGDDEMDVDAMATQLGYCWTHGTCKNRRHNSATCQNKQPGHQDEATDENKMGGSTDVIDRDANPKTRILSGTLPPAPNSYCWTHGTGRHTGENCNNKQEGHEEEATAQNKMGGSTAVLKLRN